MARVTKSDVALGVLQQLSKGVGRLSFFEEMEIQARIPSRYKPACLYETLRPFVKEGRVERIPLVVNGDIVTRAYRISK